MNEKTEQRVVVSWALTFWVAMLYFGLYLLSRPIDRIADALEKLVAK